MLSQEDESDLEIRIYRYSLPGQRNQNCYLVVIQVKACITYFLTSEESDSVANLE